MLNKIIADTASFMGIDKVLAEKLVTFIDLCKMKGLTGGESASKFADFLGYHRLPDNTISHTLFAERWTDHKVWINIDGEIRKYLNEETPLFTQSRLEPVYQTKPFYEQGCVKVDPGTNWNPGTGGTVRRPPILEEAFSNFIVHEYLPDVFYIETFKDRVPDILAHGLPVVSDADAYRIYVSPEDARSSLSRDLLSKGVATHRIGLEDYTLLELDVDKMQMDNNVFYTKTISGHKGQGSNYGYFYTASVPRDGITVSKNNIVD